MLPWKLGKGQIFPVNQNFSSVYFSLAKFQLVSSNLSLAMIWQMTHTHKLSKLCSDTLSTCLHPSSLLHSCSSSFRHATLRLLAVRLLSHPARLQTRRYYYNKGLRPDELTPSFLAALPLACLGFVSRAVTLQRKIGDCSQSTQRSAPHAKNGCEAD